MGARSTRRPPATSSRTMSRHWSIPARSVSFTAARIDPGGPQRRGRPQFRAEGFAPLLTDLDGGQYAGGRPCVRNSLGIPLQLDVQALQLGEKLALSTRAVVLFGVILQVEWVMVHRRARWGYQPWHPVVPVFGVGVPPILQPVVLLPLMFWRLARIEPSAGRRGDPRRRSPGKSP